MKVPHVEGVQRSAEQGEGGVSGRERGCCRMISLSPAALQFFRSNVTMAAGVNDSGGPKWRAPDRTRGLASCPSN